MSCRYYPHSPMGEVKTPQITKAPICAAHSIGWNNSRNSVSLLLVLDTGKALLFLQREAMCFRCWVVGLKSSIIEILSVCLHLDFDFLKSFAMSSC